MQPNHIGLCSLGTGTGNPGLHLGQTMANPYILTCALTLAAFASVACTSVQVAAPSRGDLGAELIHVNHPGPPDGKDGSCWASDTIPAVIETTTQQQLVSPQVLDETGKVVTAAVYRSNTQTRMVSEREEVWFRAPCPDSMIPEFIATLQRALKARGLYLLTVTGELDAPTLESIRRFQADRGLDSPTLSLAAAQELGIVSTELR